MTSTHNDHLTTGTRMRPLGKIVATLAFVSWSAVACAQGDSPKAAAATSTISEGGDAGTIVENPTPGGEAPAPEPTQPQAQLQLGALAYGGKACAVADGLEGVIDTGSELLLNVATTVTKQSESAIERGACAVALPVSVPAGYRLVISKIGVAGHMLIAKGATVTGLLEVFTTGNEESATIEFNGKATRGNKLVRQNFEQEAQITTECGAGINLRSNSSYLIRGGESQTHAVFAGLKVAYKLEACQ